MKRIGVAFLLLLVSSSGFAADFSKLRRWVKKHPSSIPGRAVDLAFDYLVEHSDEVLNKKYITIIDFNRSSVEKRMFVIELDSKRIASYLVAHGKNSGFDYAERFSNKVGSEMSSLGIYLTGVDYIGQHGLSMRLHGQEATNSNAEARAIVMHPAEYVSQAFIEENGRLGRSWGCPAVSPEVSDRLVDQLKNGSVFLIYHYSLSR